MSTLHLSEARLTHLVTHHVGNCSRDEGVRLSSKGSRIKQEALDYLFKYFTHHFKPEEFYNLSHPEDVKENKVYQSVKEMFEDASGFATKSQSLATLLYEVALHPNVKEGPLHVARMEGVILDGEELEVIGIFKSESTAPFLRMTRDEETYTIDAERGYEIKGMDKGCLIFNSEAEKGYRVLTHNATKNPDAKYWSDEFLQLRDASDEFHLTKDVMDITKEFVMAHMEQDFEVSKPDKIDLLNRSVEYFKANDSFDRTDFAETVLQDQQVIKSYETFDETFRESYALDPVKSFDISDTAVKKQSKVFKSVLKLDRNFSVYIHGDKRMIERGTDEDGRKYYKLFYEEEK
jgi:hypothetical protein